MGKETNRKTCPVWLGYGLNSGVRKLIHKPYKILERHIKKGMTVTDIGTGMGFMTLPMATMVGETGKVIAVDIQEGMLNRVEELAKYKGLDNNIVTVQCRRESLELKEYADTIEFALMFMMVHEVQDKRRLFQDVCEAMITKGILLIAEPIFHVSKKNFDETVGIANEVGFDLAKEQQDISVCRTVVLQKK